MAHKTLARLLIILAVAVAVPEMTRLDLVNPMQYAAYMVLALLAAAFKVRWNTPQGSVPIYLLFVLIALAGMPVPQVLILGGIAAVVECLATYRGPSRVERLLFEAAVVIIAIGMADLAIHQTHLGDARLLEAVRMVLTGVTFFVGYSFPRAFVEALDEGRHLGRVWREKYLWMVPHLAAAAVVAGVFEQANRTLGSWQIPVLAVLVSYLVYRSYRLYTARLEDGRSHAEEMADLHMRTIETLALAIDAKDETTADHLSRVQCYAMEIGRELGLAANELEALKAASLLHDIGKLAVPEHIISKPGRLTPEEFEKMKIHPVVGAEILERVRFPYPVVPIVRSHHEKWDGTGYPDRISGEAIPIGARILAAVDCLDALASDRQYRKALPLDEAIGVVVREAGRAFDPRVVEVLARRYRELEEKARSIPAVEPLKLSRGPAMPADVAPAAGFVNEGTASKGGDFLDKIAAARQEAQALFEMAQTLGSSLSLDETLSVLSVRLRRLVPYDALAVYVQRGTVLTPEFVSGENFRLFTSLEIPVGQGLSGWVAENRRPILNGNPSVEPGYLNDPTKFSTLNAALAVPVEGLQGVAGVLTLYQSQRDAYTTDHLRILQALSSKLGLAIENALRYRQAETSATTDFLTGLPNARSLFLALDGELARCRREGIPLTVVVCDLDNFKAINDEFGHLEGNRVLKAVAQSLRRQCREYDVVARMGGDEFVAVLSGLHRPEATTRIERMQKTVMQEAQIETRLPLSISLGSAQFPDDGEGAEELLALADRIMYNAKRAMQSDRATRVSTTPEQSRWIGAVQ